MSDRLNEFINAQHQTNTTTASTLGRIEQMLADNSARLFGGPNQKGALQYLHEEYDELEKSVGEVSKRVGVMELWKSGTLKWIAGAVFVVSAEGTALAFWFHQVVSHVSVAIVK